MSDVGGDVKLGELRLILDEIRLLYASAGATGPAKDLEKLIGAIELQSEASIDAFVTDIKGRLSQGVRKGRRSKKAAGAIAPLNEEAIGTYVGQLHRAGTDRPAFDAVFERLKSDKVLKLADLTEIAHRYSGGIAKHKSMAAAHQDISKAFVRQARFINKLQ